MNKEEILSDSTVAHYCDPKRGWIHEAFADGVEYGERKTINRAIEVVVDMMYDGVVDICNVEKFESIFRSKMEE